MAAKMNVKRSIQQLFRGWVPKESNLAAKLNVSSEEKKFPFNRRFYVSLAISYSLFVLLVVVPFLFGYIDSQIVGYGLVGIVYSLALMVMVRLLNDRPELRKRAVYVVVGAWLGLAVGVVGCMILLGHQIIAVIGSLGLGVLMLAVLPSLGGLIGYWMQKRKFSTHSLTELAN
jgi:hypothetical protein